MDREKAVRRFREKAEQEIHGPTLVKPVDERGTFSFPRGRNQATISGFVGACYEPRTLIAGGKGDMIGIGAAIARRPLPHHRLWRRPPHPSTTLSAPKTRRDTAALCLN